MDKRRRCGLKNKHGQRCNQKLGHEGLCSAFGHKF